MNQSHDALLLVAYGGPNGPADVMPFLENALRGRRIPHERLLEVAHHYDLFGGVSPINEQCRHLIDSMTLHLKHVGIHLPIYWGNRNWTPYLTDTLAQMKADGIRRALALFTSPYSSFSSCRQYLENIEAARAQVGDGAPIVDKLPAYYNHPLFIAAMADRIRAALLHFHPEERAAVPILFTAHSIPTAMAAGCRYVEQLHEACRLTMDALRGRDLSPPLPSGEGRGEGEATDNPHPSILPGLQHQPQAAVPARRGTPVAAGRSTPNSHPHTLVYQSRSGPPQQPWLEPDICDYLREHKPPRAVVAPIGFISDHMEVVYDLDTQARQVCTELHIDMTRAPTVGVHPYFLAAITDLVQKHLHNAPPPCPLNCCPSGAAPIHPSAAR